jgi:hypothetical protein
VAALHIFFLMHYNQHEAPQFMSAAVESVLPQRLVRLANKCLRSPAPNCGRLHIHQSALGVFNTSGCFCEPVNTQHKEPQHLRARTPPL